MSALLVWLNILVFASSAALLLYVVAGYPLLLGWMAGRGGRPVRKDDRLRTVSIVIAVRNGVRFVEDKLRSVLALDYPREMMEIIVVSDGSDDGTDESVRKFADEGVQLWRIPRAGKAAALNLGISKATGEILVLTDVRQTLEAAGLRRLAGCFGDPEVGAVSGELSIRRGETDEEMDTGLYWRYELAMRKRMSRIDSTFGTNGPYYAMRRELAVPIPQDVLLDDVYLPMAGFFRGYRIVLEPTAKARDYPTSLNSEFRRKVRTQAGLWQLLKYYPELLSGKNRMRLHFLSGKYGRLALPWLLILIAITTLFLPSPLDSFAAGVQLLFYSLAALDPAIPSGFALKRVTSPIRTFVVLVLAALVSIRVFFVSPHELWKETKVRKVGG